LANGGIMRDPFDGDVDPSHNPEAKLTAILEQFPSYTEGRYPAEDACFAEYANSDQTRSDLEQCLKTY
jgi:hypothetical protein